ncbi:IS200/IS605 family transposase [Coleofasciculus sp.]|uniref:IS200/IS605 family transposase n=1 Tax=Coleofasciculus sp. TaxID=3100458 RepID=UPI003A3B7491
MSLWRTYYHIIWATESRQPLITPERESELYRYIIGKADGIGCILHAIGGMADHIHLVVSIPPKLSVADFVKTIKGSSAYHLNHLPSVSSLAFSWQHGYGVFTLGGKQLEEAKAYVLNQKAHHLNGTAIPALERDFEMNK